MKKVILSIAFILGIIAMTNLQADNAAAPSISTVLQDNGYVEVELENLNEQVQESINALADEYDIKSLKYNSEKQLTKVELIKKDDQSPKTIILDNAGEKVQKDDKEEQKTLEQGLQNEQPSIEMLFMTHEDDRFVNIKFEDLNENVQSAIRGIIADWEIKSIMYNSEVEQTKVAAVNKSDQTEKTFLFDKEGNEVEKEQEQVEQSNEELIEESQVPVIW